jgi:hypothetical protein
LDHAGLATELIERRSQDPSGGLQSLCPID